MAGTALYDDRGARGGWWGPPAIVDGLGGLARCGRAHSLFQGLGTGVENRRGCIEPGGDCAVMGAAEKEAWVRKPRCRSGQWVRPRYV